MTNLSEIAAAAERGELAERMVAAACELAGLVRDCDREEIGEFIASVAGGQELPESITALLVVQAAMIDVGQTRAELLGWVTWDEYGNPLPGVPRDEAGPRRLDAPEPWEPEPGELKPCGTYAAWRRHYDAGEPIDEACARAAREYWAERKRVQKAKREKVA